MSSTKLTPIVERADEQDSTNIQSEYRLILPRYVFSPLLSLNTQFDLCGRNTIDPGVITQIPNYIYPQPNPRRIESPDSNEPEFANVTRKAGIIVAGLLRNYERSGDYKTGFCVLEEMTGLDPAHDQEDRKLVFDLQVTLLPEGFTDGREQYDWLESRGEVAAKNGPVYVGTLARMLKATQESIDYADTFRRDLQRQLIASSSGNEETKKGNRGQVFDIDRQICAWIGEEAPELESRLSRKPEASGVQPAAFDPMAFAQMMSAANAETLKGFASMIADALKTRAEVGDQKSEVGEETPAKTTKKK